MSSHTIEEPTSSTSKRTRRVVYRLKTTVVDPEDPVVQEVLNTIWRIRQSRGRSAHAHATEWTSEVGLGDGGTVVEAWPWE